MDTNAGNDFDAVRSSRLAGLLKRGQEVQVREAGHAPGTGVIDDMTPDGSVVWVWVDGKAPRRMFLAGTPS